MCHNNEGAHSRVVTGFFPPISYLLDFYFFALSVASIVSCSFVQQGIFQVLCYEKKCVNFSLRLCIRILFSTGSVS